MKMASPLLTIKQNRGGDIGYLQVPFHPRGQGAPVKREDGAAAPSAAGRGCYPRTLDASLERERPIQLLLQGTHQPSHPRLRHQDQHGSDLQAAFLAVTTITKARWDRRAATALTATCLSQCPTLLLTDDKQRSRWRLLGSLGETLLPALPQCAPSKVSLEVREVSRGRHQADAA
eukprot:bmy_20283T0